MDSWQGGGDSGDEDEELKDFRYGGKDATIFLVDCSPKMHLRNEERDETPFQFALKCISTTLRNKVFSQPKDEMALLLFGTQKKVGTGASDFENLSLALPMSIAEGSSILKLEELTEQPHQVEQIYGHSEDFKVHEALWQCQSLFNEVRGRVSSKSVMLMTVDDDPHASNPSLKRQAIKKAADLAETGINLQVLPLEAGSTGASSSFVWGKFYRDLIPTPSTDSGDLEESMSEISIRKKDDLLRVVRKKDHHKRSAGKLKFDLGQGAEISVSSFNLVREASAPTKLKLARDTNEPVRTQRNLVHPETAAPLLPTEMELYQTFGDRPLYMTPDEVKAAKKMGLQPGLKLMGFRKIQDLKFGDFVSGGTFIYPEEGIVKGSRNLFAALLIKCLEKDVTPICLYKRTDSSAPSFVALIPIEEQKEEDGIQTRPPGFSLFYLPFVDDKRVVPHMEFVDPGRSAVDAAVKIVKKVRLKGYSAEAFENPALQYHYRLLESIALEKADVEPGEDHTLPPYDRIRKKLGDLAETFKTECGFDESAALAPVKPAGGKRKAESSDGAAKKPKAEAPADMDLYVQNQTVNKLKLDELKAYLKSVGESVAGKRKEQLVEAVYDYFKIMK